jgi:nucleoside-diphosphate-sugar epimerase
MEVLVLGGTRFFGKRLVELLLARGHSVTIATRGQAVPVFQGDPSGNIVQRVVAERGDYGALSALAYRRNWDVVVDQICYSPDEALAACKAFEGRVGRYVHTSTASVYKTTGLRPEADFDPFTYLIAQGKREDFDYGEGKRLAEAVFFQKAQFPVAAMRIPFVLGPDDYMKRMEFHIEHVSQELPIVVPHLKAEVSFIHSAEAAKFLLWLVEGKTTGPLNACAQGSTSIEPLLQMIETHIGKKANILPSGAKEDLTPFFETKSKTLDNRKAAEQGFRFETLTSWLPQLVAELCSKYRHTS